MKKVLEEKIFCSKKKTLLFVGIIVFLVLFFYQFILLMNGSYFSGASDDVVQYEPILRQYIEYFKEGKFGFFNFSNNSGSSFFADIYYLPLDIFTLVTLLLGLMMDNCIAFSIANLLKVFLGVVVFAYFLQKRGYKNKVVTILSFIYFAVGGCWVYTVFPTYFSMFFYLPLSLLFVYYYCQGKKVILPLYCIVLILYNFYNAYTLFIFMLFAYIVATIRDSYTNLKILFKDIVGFGIHIILGVLMSLVILLPSALYILNNSVRDIRDFQLLFDFEIYVKLFYKLFVYESGVDSLVVGMNGTNGYIQNHFSIYIGISNLFILSLLFLMNDRTSKIYKWTIGVILFMMAVPVFSMIFSGVAVAYTRWFSFINIVLIYFVGYVLENIKNIENIEKKHKIGVASLGSLYLISLLLNVFFLFGKGAVIDISNNLYHIIMLVLFFCFFLLYIVFYLSKQKDLIVGVAVIEMLVAITINLYHPFVGDAPKEINKIFEDYNEVINKLDISEDSLERVYLSNTMYNSSRYTKVLTSENTFHSFLSEGVYAFHSLYKKSESLPVYVKSLSRYSPNYSRVIDYKYIVLDKNVDYGYELDYLKLYYENEDYIVYENLNYSPFYVYESYIAEGDLINDENVSLLDLEKNLFAAAILENGGSYSLEKLDFSKDDLVKRINVSKKLELDLIDANIYRANLELLNDITVEEKTLYINGENIIDKVENMWIEVDEEKIGCIIYDENYRCRFSGDIDSLVVQSHSTLDLSYNLIIEKEGDFFGYVEAPNFKEENIVYSTSNENKIVLFDSHGNAKECLYGICSVKEKDIKYIAIEVGHNDLSGEIYVDYLDDNLEYYKNNSKDKYAGDKKLIQKGSSLEVKYRRLTSSDNNQIVVLPVTYSDEWVCEDEGYELVRVNGGYLGIIVKEDVENIDVLITFKPKGVKIGFVGSLVGICIYGIYLSIVIILKNRRKSNESF